MGSCGVGKQDGWTTADMGVSGRWHGGGGHGHGYGGGRGGRGGGGGKCGGCQRKLAMTQWVIVALLVAVLVLQMKQMRMM